MANNEQMKVMHYQQLIAERKKAGLLIEPETAEVCWQYRYTLDPYDICHDLPQECQQVGREYFARAPGSEVWVCFNHLPKATERALWKKLGRFVDDPPIPF